MTQTSTRTKPRKRKKNKARARDRHYLYSAAVQSVDADLQFFGRVYQKKNARRFKTLREDFCGTAVLAREFVKRKPGNRAWGVDLDRPTLDWGDTHYDEAMGESRSRLELICDDVQKIERPRVDLVAALNFSYSVFKTRAELGSYFRKVRRSVRPGGVFVLDAWGGTETMTEDRDKRRIDAERAFDGTKVPAFTYFWDQAKFNPINHHSICHIHFKLADGTKLKRAFSYDWRLWTLPELVELLAEAGFASTVIYGEGWDKKNDEADGVFRKKTYFENEGAWVVYLVALT
jgi:SAM-dependent methyltransferase